MGAFLHTLCSLLEIILVCSFSKLQFLLEFLTAPSGLDEAEKDTSFQGV